MTEKDSALLRRKPLALTNLTVFVLRIRRGLYPKTNPAEKGYQTAQGMVEFALVLPVLLLIIFGIIAAGHLFFSYSLVVNASREAARLGSAVGLTQRSIPAYRDCDEIRDHAVRVGTFAGVEDTEASVQIAYDKGPKLDGTDADVYADGCPMGGVGPGYVGLGDRLVVTVSVMYEPIVPLIPIPSFPLTAVSRRTIVLGMPVGDAPVAASLCTGTITRIIPPSWETGLSGSFSRAGEMVSFDVEVIPDDPSITLPGTLYMYMDDATYTTPVCQGSPPLLDCSTDFTWTAIEKHTIRARYASGVDPTANPCYLDTKAEPLVHWVLPTDTQISIVPITPNPSLSGEPVLVQVEVIPIAPGGGTPEGPVHISDQYGKSCEFSLDPDKSSPGIGRGSCSLVLTEVGLHTITATFDPANTIPYFNSSQTTASQYVEEEEEDYPPPHVYYCPAITTFADGPYAGEDFNFPAGTNSIQIAILNTGPDEVKIDDTLTLDIASIEINWPNTDPQAPMNRIIRGTEILWTSGLDVKDLYPPTQVLSSENTNWVIPKETRSLLTVDFSSVLPSGQNYSVTVRFKPNPYMTCPEISASGVK